MVTFDVSDDARTTGPQAHGRGPAAAVLVAVITLVTAAIVAASVGVPLRDPGHVTLKRLVATAAIVVVLVAVDIVAGGRRRWTRQRSAGVLVCVLGFYATYLAYRNLKSLVPLVRPDALFDGRLSRLDRGLLGGHDPGAVLHDILGSGVSAHVLSAVYMAFFAFIPLAVAAALVFTRRANAGAFFVAALALNWLLGAGSYFLLPSIGPFHAAPATFAHLPVTPVTHLQHTLETERAAFLRDPQQAGAAQSIGAFASLHVAIYVTAGLAAHVLRWRRAIKAVIWTLAGLTALATVYFGWHYLLDDVGGVVIAGASVVLAARLTGIEVRKIRSRAG